MTTVSKAGMTGARQRYTTIINENILRSNFQTVIELQVHDLKFRIKNFEADSYQLVYITRGRTKVTKHKRTKEIIRQINKYLTTKGKKRFSNKIHNGVTHANILMHCTSCTHELSYTKGIKWCSTFTRKRGNQIQERRVYDFDKVRMKMIANSWLLSFNENPNFVYSR